MQMQEVEEYICDTKISKVTDFSTLILAFTKSVSNKPSYSFTLNNPSPPQIKPQFDIFCWNSHQDCANMVNVNALFLQMAIRISATTDQKMSPQKNWRGKNLEVFFPNNPIWNKIEVQFSSFEGNVSLHQVKSLKINLIKRTVQRISFHSKEHYALD